MKKKTYLVAAAAFLGLALVHIYLGQGPIRVFSPTYDEPVHLTAGVAFLKAHDYRFNGYGHPPLAEAWAAWPVVRMNPVLPVHDPAWIAQRWTAQDQYRFADRFFTRNRIPAERMLIWGRTMQQGLSVLLGAAVAVVAFCLAGWVAAVGAVVFWAFSPTVLAHGTLITTDLMVAFFFFVFFAALALRKTWRGDALAGVALAGALAAKYSAMIILPAAVALAGWTLMRSPKRWDPGEAARRGGVIIGAMAVTLLLIFWRAGFDVFFSGFQSFFSLAQAGRSSFFLGMHRTEGWLAYFPVLIGVKSAPALLLTGAAAVLLVLRRRIILPPALWIPPLVYLALACFSKVQIGHRHMLPIYPFLFVMAGMALAALPRRQILFAVAVLWLAGEAVWNRPHYLSYFNLFAGGPSRGHLIATDSNVDWGQGLKALAAALSPEDRERGIYLSYFGVADPRAYGIRFLDIGSDRLAGHAGDSHAGLDPQRFAISVTNRRATYYADKSVFDWLDAYTPKETIARSIFIYDFSNHPEARERLQQMRMP